MKIFYLIFREIFFTSVIFAFNLNVTDLNIVTSSSRNLSLFGYDFSFSSGESPRKMWVEKNLWVFFLNFFF